MDWSKESAAERTCEPGDAVQCPNERKPIFLEITPPLGASYTTITQIVEITLSSYLLAIPNNCVANACAGA
jgi:hypothetical protein